MHDSHCHFSQRIGLLLPVRALFGVLTETLTDFVACEIDTCDVGLHDEILAAFSTPDIIFRIDRSVSEAFHTLINCRR